MTAHTEALRALAAKMRGTSREFNNHHLWTAADELDALIATLPAEAGSAGAVEDFDVEQARRGSEILDSLERLLRNNEWGFVGRWDEVVAQVLCELRTLQSTLTRQQAEIEGLRDDLEAIRTGTSLQHLKAVARAEAAESELATLRQRVGAAEADARRWKWVYDHDAAIIRTNDGYHVRAAVRRGDDVTVYPTHKTPEAAIDAAQAEERAEGGRE